MTTVLQERDNEKHYRVRRWLKILLDKETVTVRYAAQQRDNEKRCAKSEV